MNRRAFSLVEVLIAAAVLTVGLAAAAVLASTIMAQQQRDSVALRAANLQEQAVRLFRMDLLPSKIPPLLPENSVATGSPPAGGYSLTFLPPTTTNVTISDGTVIKLLRRDLKLTYAEPSGGGGLRTNTVTIIRPSIRVEYPQ